MLSVVKHTTILVRYIYKSIILLIKSYVFMKSLLQAMLNEAFTLPSKKELDNKRKYFGFLPNDLKKSFVAKFNFYAEGILMDEAYTEIHKHLEAIQDICKGAKSLPSYVTNPVKKKIAELYELCELENKNYDTKIEGLIITANLLKEFFNKYKEYTNDKRIAISEFAGHPGIIILNGDDTIIKAFEDILERFKGQFTTNPTPKRYGIYANV